jgi:hypothetical protein
MTTNLSKFWRENKMDCPYQEFWFDGNYWCSFANEPCEGLPCDIASEFIEISDEDD